MEPNRIVVIVDPFSTGKYLTAKFEEYPGVKCIYVISKPGGYSVFHHIRDLNRAKDYYEFPLTFNNQNPKEALKYLPELINKIAQDHPIGKIACIVNGSEPGAALAAMLHKVLKKEKVDTQLPSPQRNKFTMRKAFEKAGLPVPKFIKTNQLNELLKWLDKPEIKLPIVLKLLDSGGADGVYICKTHNNVIKFFNDLMQRKETVLETSINEIIAETYLNGPEFVVNSVSCNSYHVVTDIWLYHKVDIGNQKVYEHEELLDPTDSKYAQLINTAHAALDAIDIKNGPSHAEVIIEKDGTPFVVEVGARLGGAFNPDVMQECMSREAASLTAKAYLDPDAFAKEPKTTRKLKHAYVIDLVSTRNGIVQSFDFSPYESLPSHRTTIPHIKVGGRITATENLLSIPVSFHLANSSLSQLNEDYQKTLEANNAIKLEPTLTNCKSILANRQPSNSNSSQTEPSNSVSHKT